MKWTLNFGLLFINHQGTIFVVCTLIALCIWLEIIWASYFSKGSKRRMTKEEKQRSSHLATLKEFKPALIKVNFNEDEIVLEKEDIKEIENNDFYKKT